MNNVPLWTAATARSFELRGAMLLTNAAVLLIGASTSLGVAASPRHDTDATANPPLAVEEHYKACDAGDLAGCNQLGVAYQRGDGTEPDEGVALGIFTRACSAGHAEACSNEGALLERALPPDANVSPVRVAYARACDGGAALGCSNLGALHAVGRGMPRDLELALWYFDRACQLGSPIGCENQAILQLEVRERRSRPSAHVAAQRPAFSSRLTSQMPSPIASPPSACRGDRLDPSSQCDSSAANSGARNR